MYIFILAALLGGVAGLMAKQLTNKDIAQGAIGVLLGTALASYIPVFLQVVSVESLIGSTLTTLLGIAAPILGSLIAAGIGLGVYLVVAYVTAIFVRM
jgi:uncharacterized membrane protein YeaQ/YmgE (transglycosylase-associated protein family)